MTGRIEQADINKVLVQNNKTFNASQAQAAFIERLRQSEQLEEVPNTGEKTFTGKNAKDDSPGY